MNNVRYVNRYVVSGDNMTWTGPLVTSLFAGRTVLTLLPSLLCRSDLCNLSGQSQGSIPTGDTAGARLDFYSCSAVS